MVVEKAIGHKYWRLSLLAALMVRAIWKGWVYLPSSLWWTRDWGEVRLLLLTASSTLGILVYTALSKWSPIKPLRVLSNFGMILTSIAYLLYTFARFPVLVWTGLVDLECALPLTTGMDAAVDLFGAPLAEEVTYRALPLGFALASNSKWVICLVLALSTVLFTSGHTHVSPAEAFNIGLSGLFYGLIFLRTAKLWPVVLFHSADNLLVRTAEWGWHEAGYPLCI